MESRRVRQVAVLKHRGDKECIKMPKTMRRRDHLQNLGIDTRIMSKLIVKKYDGNEWVGLM
jgi:hypothetical protein